MSVGTKLLQAAAGGGSDPVYVDDLFSTFLYEGTNTSTAHQIQNGIDLSEEGGLVWIKKRDSNIANTNHHLVDTERGNYYLASNSTNAQASGSDINTFNSDGWTFNASTGLGTDYLGSDYVSWTFRKQEKFFDVVTYTGDGTTGRQIAHNLGSSPGMMFFKKTNGTGDWKVFHRSLSGSGLNGRLRLDSTGAEVTLTNNFFVSSTYFGSDYYNASGDEWVVYLFAHDEQDFGKNSDEAIIKCGSYTGSGSTGKFVDLGFEPQWVLVKNTDAGTPWVIIDIMRGMPVGGDGVRLLADQNVAEVSSASYFAPRPTGMEVTQQNTYVNTSGEDYIYMAIRRPNKPASEFAATDLFAVANATTNAPLFVSSFPVDAGFYHVTTSTKAMYFGSRLQGAKYMFSYTTAAEVTNNDHKWDFMDGWYNNSFANTDYVSYMFRRTPGFFDVVAYTGDGTNGRTVSHNLGVTPEIMIVKSRSAAENWFVFHSATGATKATYLNAASATATSVGFWNDTAPTSSVFSTYSAFTNASSATYIAYLFATVAGISKVGSYTGTGSDLNVDCGFSAGAKFVLIRRTDSTGDWYVYDSVRGIVAGNDPYFLLNSGAVDVTNTDYIDPLSSGFTVTSSAPAGLNASSGTYIFLAIA